MKEAGIERVPGQIAYAPDVETAVSMAIVRSDERSPRQVSRSQTKKDGDRSAKLARVLMDMKQAALVKLELDDELREAIDRARKVESLSARRRAERTLAGDLRGIDLVELATKIENAGTGNDPGIQHFHTVERWRDRLLAEDAALAEFPAPDDELPRLIAAAKRERDTGKPPGAQRTLFRHISSLLKP